ncbi:transforming growth factor beta-1-induced transcript 1 protein isoform X2 [Condylostylus longicornis]|uniref:transforming growth factor beta-1-induced transcript 1 protein isoform X2 n=1 Tax=Condylostylus longicornis TaxID=2530218 RepID=UPI00244E209F|nr:transforming growth factor beta-1-induced transcript 1 protein isoform X2 [Condylostylus longicornis]
MSSDNKCYKCNEVITKRIITAMGKSWHPEHFTCRECKEPIKDLTFNEKFGEPVCSECFLAKYSDICYACKQPIREKIIKALGHTWHEDHFVCNGICEKPLSGSTFYERDGKAYCKDDFEQMFAEKCFGCTKPITDKAVIALDAKWHKDCFKCKKCDKAITSNTFAVEDNKPLCTICAN